jgi:hypothetical protein
VPHVETQTPINAAEIRDPQAAESRVEPQPPQSNEAISTPTPQLSEAIAAGIY